jgi:hypothetical protein
MTPITENPPTENFETRLLRELQRVVTEQSTHSSLPAARPRRRRRLLPAAGVAAAAAAAAVGVIVVSDATGPSDAYAVDRAADGTVTVEIRSLSDAAGLEDSLRNVGVPAIVDYVPSGQAGCGAPGPAAGPEAGAGGSAGPSFQTDGEGATEAGPSFQTDGEGQTGGAEAGPSLSAPPPEELGPGTAMSQVTLGSDGGATFTIDPGDIEPRENVYITTSTGDVSSIAMAIGKDQPSLPCAPPSATP